MPRGPAFACTACGALHAKWSGRCDACGAWNTIAEDAPLSPRPPGRPAAPARSGTSGRGRRAMPLSGLVADDPPPPRARSGLAEFDRVLGGGLVPGSAILIGGDPGIGKSTLLLQAGAAFARAGLSVLYVSGEESAAQIRLRAERLGLSDAPVRLGTETALEAVLAALEAERPDVAVIDSVQTLWLEGIEAAPGSVAQVRAVAQEAVAFAKRRGTAVILVGHVTKDGQIAGPRVVEHLVDCVLYFEGERGHAFRLLRAVKNRFGPTGEIGVFEMTGAGLAEVANPSALFLSERDRPAPGAAVFAGIEGTRPMLAELQALVAPSGLAQPRRTVVGLDPGRLAMILAVLEARCGIPFAGLDVFLNVAGGLRVTEPAADLAVAAALLSAREDIALPPDTVFFGEIGLSGALRPVAQAENRLKEAAKLGFTSAVAPPRSGAAAVPGITVREAPDLAGLVGDMFGAG
jgi:DNA repair protein RadA/Sms